jgi:hypothetical protein
MLWVALLLTPSHARNSVIYFADTHVGEGCNSSDTNYQLNDTNCYSVRDLAQTVTFINQLKQKQNVSMVIIGGDITSSAQETEFIAAKRELDLLTMPYLPTMGNHDVWSYDQVVGDRTTTPVADRLFAATFAHQFEAFQARGGGWISPYMLGLSHMHDWSWVHDREDSDITAFLHTAASCMTEFRRIFQVFRTRTQPVGTATTNVIRPSSPGPSAETMPSMIRSVT